MISFSSSRGAVSRNSGGRRHPFDKTKNHLALFV
jgi:hypothetical protein